MKKYYPILGLLIIGLLLFFFTFIGNERSVSTINNDYSLSGTGIIKSLNTIDENTSSKGMDDRILYSLEVIPELVYLPSAAWRNKEDIHIFFSLIDEGEFKVFQYQYDQELSDDIYLSFINKLPHYINETVSPGYTIGEKIKLSEDKTKIEYLGFVSQVAQVFDKEIPHNLTRFYTNITPAWHKLINYDELIESINTLNDVEQRVNTLALIENFRLKCKDILDIDSSTYKTYQDYICESITLDKCEKYQNFLYNCSSL